jgi:hypothetical protein
VSLAWREFEQKARALYRSELKRSPELRKEFKRQRKPRNSAFVRLARQSALPLIWMVLFFRIISQQTNLELPAAVISLWAAGSALAWAHRWFQQFYASEDLVVLSHLPLSDAQIFSFQTRRYLTGAGWTFWEMLLAYGALALLTPPNGPPIYAFFAAAVLQSVLVIALAMHFAARFYMLTLGLIGGLLRMTALLLLIFGVQDFEFARFLVQGSQWFFPTGWVNYMLIQGQADRATLGLLIPIFAIIYLARYSLNQLRNVYSLEGVEIVASSRSGPAGAQALNEEELNEGSFSRPGPTEIEEHIAARSFLEGVNWENAGWLERLIGRFLSGGERIIAEFLVAQNPGWTGSLQRSFWVWLTACVVVAFLGQLGGTVVFFSAYVLATASLPLFGGDWRGMRQIASAGVYLPAYSLYPISFNAVAKILLKVNIIRIAAAIPLVISFGTLSAYKLEIDPVAGAVFSVKLLTIFICLQPLFVLLPISSTTNDTARLHIIWWVLLFAGLLGIFGAAAGVFISRSAAGVLASYATLGALSTTLFLLYRRAYRRGKFDLFNQRATGQG